MTGRGYCAAAPGDPRAFRGALGRFATGVTIVTASAPDGMPAGATVSSFNAVSLQPPLVLFSMGHGLRSLALFRQAPSFAIHVLDRAQAELARRFGRQEPGERPGAKWQNLAFDRGQGGAPILADALACFECRPHARHPAGDHDIFVVEVLRLALRDDGDPLLFYAGQLLGLEPEGRTRPC
ncbi:MAG: flavin reductase family protein [Sneathiellaceae bacterium]